MPYCHTNFYAVPPEQVVEILSLFTRENFVGGISAYQLNDGSYSVDAGENDIRAYYDELKQTIQFFCRHERDMPLYDRKLLAFASNEGINT